MSQPPGKVAARRELEAGNPVQALLILNALLAEDGSAKEIAQTITKKLDDLAAKTRAVAADVKVDRQRLVLHYAGRMFMEDKPVEADLARKVGEFIEQHQLVGAYGSLACGADILNAEQLIRHNIDVTVVLASPSENFEATSVAIGGPGWRNRFHHILDQASEIIVLGEPHYASDANSFAQATKVAMGRAVLKAGSSNCRLHQLMLTGGQSRGSIAGSDSDAAQWQSKGRQSTIIECDSITRPPTTSNANPPLTEQPGLSRLASMILIGSPEQNRAQKTGGLNSAGNLAADLNKRFPDEHFQILAQDHTTICVISDEQNPLVLARQLSAHITARAQSTGRSHAILIDHGIVIEGTSPASAAEYQFGAQVARSAGLISLLPPGYLFATTAAASVYAHSCSDAASFVDAGTISLDPLVDGQRIDLTSVA
jgi:hypothetical protein